MDKNVENNDQPVNENPESRAKLESAIRYATLGVPVFPLYTVKNGVCACGNPACGSPGKHPIPQAEDGTDIAPHGFKDATSDTETVGNWWFDYTINANIGVVTGEPSGLYVLDVDPRNGGLESLKALEGSMVPCPLRSSPRRAAAGSTTTLRRVRPRVASWARGSTGKRTAGTWSESPART